MIAAAVIASMLSPTASKANGEPLSAFHCGTAQEVTRVPDDSLNAAYVQGSVEIIRKALAKETFRLSKVVSQDATASLFHNDNGVVSPYSGARAVIELLGSIEPRRYEFFEPRGFPGPALNPC